MLISVVVATRNAAADLPRCLDSLRAQTMRDFEVLVADGASTDGTLALLEASRDLVAWWDSVPDSGPYAARNRALAHTRGEWICFLGADDWIWDERVFERLAPQLRQAPRGCRVIYGRLRQITSGGELVAESGEPWQRARASFRSYRCLPHPGLMHHRSLFEAHGRFDESYKMAGDYELLLRELKSRDAHFVPILVAGMGFRGQTTSPEFFLRLQQETERALAAHGLRPPPLRWAYWKLTARVYARLHGWLGDRRARRLADLYRLVTLREPRYAGGRIRRR